jgi:cation transport ATPase
LCPTLDILLSPINAAAAMRLSFISVVGNAMRLRVFNVKGKNDLKHPYKPFVRRN